MKVLDGNTACSNIAYKLSDISFIYPITPSSPMASNIDSLKEQNTKNIFNDQVNVIEMQSEAGAAGSLHGALNAGNLAVTFTASQGLLLMIPNMYKIAGECLPAVIHVAARSLATHALSIFGDHQDIYAVRQTGFSILASTNVQDAQNLALIAHLSAIESSMPFLHFFDGFRTSHEYNQVEEIKDETIKKLVNYDKIKEFRKKALNSGKSITKGTAQNEDIYFQSVESKNLDYLNLPNIVNNYMQKLNKEIGTNYKPFNYYGNKNAKIILVAMGSVCDTIKQVIKTNHQFGLIEVHLYRPFSKEYFLKVLPKTTKIVGVLDKTKEHGSTGEPLYLDILATLQNQNIQIYGGRYGLASKNVTPNDIYDIYMNLLNKPKNNFTVGITDDVTNTSLKHYKYTEETPYEELKIYGYGSDGLVSASKDIIKILSKTNYIQGYFEYDSKKSGGVTVSHLRLSKEQINAPYYVNHPKLIAVTKDEYFHKYNMLEGLKPNGTLLINTNKTEQELNNFLPNNVKEYITKNNIETYTIDATKLAEENKIKGKISLIMETSILHILNISNYEKILITNIKERFKTKGEEIVNSNINAIKKTLQNLNKITITPTKTFNLQPETTIFETINNRKGNTLTVKQLLPYKDGTFEGATTKFEKRKITDTVPKWEKEKCIKCGICSLVCPHAVIRPFEETGEFKIIVSEADCTSCGLCINNCPKQALKFGRYSEENQQEANYYFNNYNNPKYPLTTIKNIQMRKPLFEFSGACAGCGETPYIKLLTQIVGEKLVIANATGCSSIYGASCPNTPYNLSWSNSLFEDAAEYGYGILQSYNNLKNRIITILQQNKDPKSKELLNYLNEHNNYDEIKQELNKYKDIIPEELQDYVTPKSVWTIGGDGWAYDIGFSGLDHVLSSNEKARILVLDTEVYSNTGGQSSKSSHIGQVCEFANTGKKTNKKDLFRIAMSYPNIYIASISLGANMMQAVKAIKEAEEHNGPSLIIAYCPCIEQGIKGGMSNSIKEESLAVDSGYVLLMRYQNEKLTIDSKEPNFDKYDEFLSNEVRYNSLKIKDKTKAEELLKLNKQNAIKRYNYYKEISNK